MTIFQGAAVGVAYLAAVFISNLPKRDFLDHRPRHRGLEEATHPVDVDRDRPDLGVASLAGYGLFQHAPPHTVAFVLAFAAGAILTMLADTMMPEAFEHGGNLVGVVTTLGSRSPSPSTPSTEPTQTTDRLHVRSRRSLKGR